MTETTSIQNFMSERRAYAPLVKQPGLATFIAQAAIGSFCGAFVVLLVRILLAYRPHNDFFVLYLPFLMAVGLAIGVLAGLFIWAGTKETEGPLLGITRTLLGVFVTGLTWFGVWYYLLEDNNFTEGLSSWEAQLWLLSALVVSGVSIGVLTGSRLRPWRELVRGGETKDPLLKLFAEFVGFVLRTAVLLVLPAVLVMALATTQMYIFEFESRYPHLLTSVVWYLLVLGHFATGLVVLFARIRLSSLVVLTVISTSPVVAGLLMTEWNPAVRNFLIGYLGVWVLFLVTRWRQTDVAFAFLKAELRYYLID